MPKVPFDISKGWLPDLPIGDVAQEGGLNKAQNVYPVTGGYGPVSALAKYCQDTDLITGTPLIGILAQAQSDGKDYNFLISIDSTAAGADPGALTYRFDRSTLIDLTYASKVAAVPSYVGSCGYGDWLITTDYVDAPLVKKVLTSADKFVLLGGTPPKARYCIMSHGHLILANLYYSSAAHPKTVMWSGKELPEGIDTANPTNLATGADIQDFPDLDGIITGLVNLGDGWAVFSERSITTAYYSGGTYRFSFNRNVVKGIGCYYPGSLISIGDACFFWSKDSIWQYSNGGGLKDIGKYHKNTVVKSTDRAFASRIIASHNSTLNIIYWTYSVAGATSATNILAYNYLEDRFTDIVIPVDMIMYGALNGVTYEGLIAANGYGPYSELGMPYSELDGGYESGLLAVGAGEAYVSSDDGAIMTALLETGEVSDPETVVTMTKVFVPIDSGEVAEDSSSPSGTVQVLDRYSEMDPRNTTRNPVNIKSDGTADVRVSNRRLSLKIQSSNFSRINTTINVNLENSGGR